MRMIWMAVMAVVTLSGCAETMGELRAKTPYATFQAKKPDGIVAECIRDAWQEQTFGGVTSIAAIQSSGKSTVVVTPASGIPQELVEISKGSVSFHVAISGFESRKRKRAEAVQSCM